jgi:protein-tyrosine-phosphatase
MTLFEITQHRRARVLFVSQTNACRGQMAEAFARALGDDVLLAFSAGVWPAEAVSDTTRVAMAEGATPLFIDQAPKRMADFDLAWFDLIVNLSACRLAADTSRLTETCVLESFVPAPLAGDLDSHRDVRDQVEKFVRFLVEHLRTAREWNTGTTSEAERQTMPPLLPEAAPQPDASRQAAF